MTVDANPAEDGTRDTSPDRDRDPHRTWTVQPIAPAVSLVCAGMALVVIAVFSDQWLKTADPYKPFRVADQEVSSVGLLTNVTNHHGGVRWIILAFLAGTALSLLIGLFARWALYVSLASAALAALCASWWILIEREVQAGPAFTIAIAGLVAVAAGVTHALMVPIASTLRQRREVGDLVDGLKHGRWHVYDDRGACVTIEEWDRGRLVARRPVRTATPP